MSLRRKLERLRPDRVGLTPHGPSGDSVVGEAQAVWDPEALAGDLRFEPPRRRWWQPRADTLEGALPGEEEDSPWSPVEAEFEAADSVESGPVEAGLAGTASSSLTARELEGDPRSERIAKLGRMIQAVADREAARAKAREERVRAGLPGRREETPAGALRCAVEHLGPEHCHGRVRLSRALHVDAESVAGLALDPSLKDVDLSRALYLDTETTGLGGGTGVVPFLVGLAWFEDGAMVVEQLLLEELGEESAMLDRIRARIEASSCIVSYNGKSYDLPLLSARAVMCRKPPLPERPHLDLLHCSRRVYKPRLGRVRLVDMEAEVLGMRRVHDVDGAEIPELYWSYLREGRPELLGPIIEHNAHDVAALAAILAVLAERYAALHREDDPRDQLARAKVGLRSADLERAERFAAAAAEGGGRASVTAEAFTLLGKIRLKRANVVGAKESFEAGLEALGSGHPILAAPLHLELAKLWEHRLRSPERALAHAQSCAAAEGPEAQRKRVARLEKRLARRGWTRPSGDCKEVELFPRCESG